MDMVYGWERRGGGEEGGRRGHGGGGREGRWWVYEKERANRREGHRSRSSTIATRLSIPVSRLAFRFYVWIPPPGPLRPLFPLPLSSPASVLHRLASNGAPPAPCAMPRPGVQGTPVYCKALVPS